MNGAQRMTADALGLTVGELRAIRAAGLDPRAVAVLRRADLITPTDGAPMPDDTPPDLTADELEAARLTGMTPERYAAVRDAVNGTPRSIGGRSVNDLMAALRAADRPKETT
ncbi:hypothetical protein [Miltoncostaea marina]|uniref:hypothetical protein n=1 Tax=Miltoncostaea marina TaxID=2843215 RepID=UPI001C3D9086|nr:hypothetical protein [Miltoncostaea marina]